MMQRASRQIKTLPLDVAGSSTFGILPKISIAQTWNMILSDGWNVPTGGYKKVLDIDDQNVGRAIYSSFRNKTMIAVIGDGVYSVSPNLYYNKIGTLNTYRGNVSIAENEKSEIAICDGTNIWIYNYFNGTFQLANTATSAIPFIPTYVAYQKGFFIAGASNFTTTAANAGWRLCDITNSLNWPGDSQHVGGFQTKADNVVAVIPFPGGSNLLYVIGNIVIEPWYNLGLALFPYSLQQYNIDYGTINPSSLDYNENMVVWIGQNEKSEIVLMYSTGNAPQRISTDGINYLLNNLTTPQDCYGFLFKQNGHLLYQFTFPTDNVSLLYDFDTDKFFNVSDENMNYHIAREVCLFNNNNYFVSNKDGGIYQFGTNFTNYNLKQIPRIRKCSPIRGQRSNPFLCNRIQFTMEMGQDDIYWNNEASLLYTDPTSILLPTVGLSMSYDGGYTFSAEDVITCNPVGNRQNRVTFYQMGYGNEMTPQLRFGGFGRALFTDGIIDISESF